MSQQGVDGGLIEQCDAAIAAIEYCKLGGGGPNLRIKIELRHQRGTINPIIGRGPKGANLPRAPVGVRPNECARAPGGERRRWAASARFSPSRPCAARRSIPPRGARWGTRIRSLQPATRSPSAKPSSVLQRTKSSFNTKRSGQVSTSGAKSLGIGRCDSLIPVGRSVGPCASKSSSLMAHKTRQGRPLLLMFCGQPAGTEDKTDRACGERSRRRLARAAK